MSNKVILWTIIILSGVTIYYYSYHGVSPKLVGPVKITDALYYSDGGSFTIGCEDANGEIYYFVVSGNLHDNMEDFGFYFTRSYGIFSLPYYPKKGGSKEREIIDNLMGVIMKNAPESVSLKLKAGKLDQEVLNSEYVHLYSVAQFLQQRQVN